MTIKRARASNTVHVQFLTRQRPRRILMNDDYRKFQIELILIFHLKVCQISGIVFDISLIVGVRAGDSRDQGLVKV